MSWRVEPFEAGHLDHLRLQEAQAFLRSVMGPDYGSMLQRDSRAFSGFWDDRLIGCAGVTPLWPGVETAWTLLGNTGMAAFICAHRAVKAFLDQRMVARIETMVDCDHVQGHRWARMLGFVCEAPCLVGRSSDGRDMAMYARIRR